MNNQELIAFAESAIRQAYECQDDIPFGLSEEQQAEVRLFEIAVAALTAEPVAFTAQSNIDGFGGGVGYMWPPGNEKPTDVALYANPIDNTAQQYEALAGWKMVPVEPTEEMVAAWRKDMNQSYAREFSEKIGEDEVVFAYQAMLEAAPKPEDKR